MGNIIKMKCDGPPYAKSNITSSRAVYTRLDGYQLDEPITWQFTPLDITGVDTSEVMERNEWEKGFVSVGWHWLAGYEPRPLYAQVELRKGFTWDGASGALDSDAIMFPAMIHDALYRWLRWAEFSPTTHEALRRITDDEFRDLCVRCGMSRLRAWYVHRAVRKFGRCATLPKARRERLEMRLP